MKLNIILRFFVNRGPGATKIACTDYKNRNKICKLRISEWKLHNTCITVSCSYHCCKYFVLKNPSTTVTEMIMHCLTSIMWMSCTKGKDNTLKNKVLFIPVFSLIREADVWQHAALTTHFSTSSGTDCSWKRLNLTSGFYKQFSIVAFQYCHSTSH